MNIIANHKPGSVQQKVGSMPIPSTRELKNIFFMNRTNFIIVTHQPGITLLPNPSTSINLLINQSQPKLTIQLFKSNQIKSNQIKSNQIKSNQIKSNQTNQPINKLKTQTTNQASSMATNQAAKKTTKQPTNLLIY